MTNTTAAREYNRFLVRSKTNPFLVLTTSGEFLPEALLGPGGRSAKLYKTERGARAAGAPGSTLVQRCDQYGVTSGEPA